MTVLTKELEPIVVEIEIQILVHFDSRKIFSDTRKNGQSKLPSKKLRSPN